jgi:outer membrane protein W
MKVFLIIVFVFIFSSSAIAQFIGGSSVLGPHIGVSNVARATVLGVKFEEGATTVGPGTIGISGKVDYYSSNAGSLGNQTYIFGVISANYHITIADGSFDPFFGFGLGYLSETNKFPDASGITFYNTDGSGFRFVFSFGARYFLSQNLALRLEFGTSLIYAVGGFDFGF